MTHVARGDPRARRGDPRRDRQGDRRPGGDGRAPADRARRAGPRAARRPAGHRQDLPRAVLRRARAGSSSGASSSPPTCCRATSSAPTCSTSRPASSPSPAGRSSASCCSPTRSTAPRPRPRPRCSRRCRSGASRSTAQTHALSDRFMVVATQNPIESQGVYPLPEAQLDRFLFKLLVPYPERRGGSARSSRRFGERSGPPRPADFGIATVADAAALARGAGSGQERDAGRRGDRLHRARWCARRATAATSPAAPARAPRCCWPTPRAPAPRSTAATTCCPTTSRRSPPRRCATACCCRPRPRSKASRSRTLVAGLVEQTEAPK